MKRTMSRHAAEKKLRAHISGLEAQTKDDAVHISALTAECTTAARRIGDLLVETGKLQSTIALLGASLKDAERDLQARNKQLEGRSEAVDRVTELENLLGEAEASSEEWHEYAKTVEQALRNRAWLADRAGKLRAIGP